VRDLVGNLRAGRDKEVTSNPADMAGEVAERVANATAEAKKGVADNERAAIEKIRAALG